MHQMVDRGRFPPTKSSQSDTLQEVKSPILVNQFDSCYLLGST